MKQRVTPLPPTSIMPSKTRGNILFLILLAVVLFAALSYAVTQSMRGGGNNASKENASLIASDILSYASLIEVETNRIMLINNIPWWNVNLGHELYRWIASGAPAPTIRGKNPNCTSSATLQCDIFTYYDGTVAARSFAEYAQDGSSYNNGTPVPGEVQFRNQGIVNVGTSAPEVMLTIFGLNKSVCDALNTRLGLILADDAGTVTPGGTFIGARDYWEEQTDVAKFLPSIASAYNGQRSFCYRNSFYGYNFVHAIITR